MKRQSYNFLPFTILFFTNGINKAPWDKSLRPIIEKLGFCPICVRDLTYNLWGRFIGYVVVFPLLFTKIMGHNILSKNPIYELKRLPFIMVITINVRFEAYNKTFPCTATH